MCQKRIFRGAYGLSGTGIVEKNHRTINFPYNCLNAWKSLTWCVIWNSLMAWPDWPWIWGKGHSRSLKVVSFNRSCMVSY